MVLALSLLANVLLAVWLWRALPPAPAPLPTAVGEAVVLRTPGGEHAFEGLGYLTGFALPNLYFHVATAYAILRHNGVPLGKLDYLGRS